MKTILPFLFLLSFVCYGQDTLYSIGYIEPDTATTYTVKYNLTKEQMDSVNKGEIVLLSRGKSVTLELLRKYKSWCKKNPVKNYYARVINGTQLAGSNLSTQEDMEEIRKWNTGQWMELSKWKYELLTKEGMDFKTDVGNRKPTLEGFIEWLRKK